MNTKTERKKNYEFPIQSNNSASSSSESITAIMLEAMSANFCTLLVLLVEDLVFLFETRGVGGFLLLRVETVFGIVGVFEVVGVFGIVGVFRVVLVFGIDKVK